MVSQFGLDFKRLARTSTTVVIYLAFGLLLLTSFFMKIHDDNYGPGLQLGHYTATMGSLDKAIDRLEKVKPKTKQVKAELKSKTTQKTLIDEINLADTQLVASPVLSAQDPDPVNRLLLKLARFQVKETAAGRGAWLELYRVEGEPTDSSLLGRKKAVLLYQTLLKRHRSQLFFNAARLPAASYLTAQLRSGQTTLLLLAVVVLLVAESFTLDQRKHTTALQQTLPHEPFGVLVARVGATFVLAVLVLAAALATVFVIVGLHDGWGNWAYPLIYSPNGRTAAVLTLGRFAAGWGGLIVLAVLLLTALGALVSLYTAKMGLHLASGVAVILLAVPVVLTAAVVRPVVRFLPSAYLQPAPMLLHEASWPQLPLGGGLAVLLGWTVGLLGLGWLRLKWHPRGQNQ
ncbi:hypothetical protein ACFQ3L_03175 [Lacticaseibacillus jixianensis]|uniref:ABC transporter permease n=1 Tax=Lacticaseibacillus jixianensis TaxID=2486012 RepID=A0ABW4B8F5_9LACO|nr:hypothetical protein [Lacticaseibacillus jixianensis]